MVIKNEDKVDKPHNHPIVERPSFLYLKDGSKASMKEIMEWWRYYYPPDIFPGGPLREIYDAMGKLLNGEYRY